MQIEIYIWLDRFAKELEDALVILIQNNYHIKVNFVQNLIPLKFSLWDCAFMIFTNKLIFWN